MREETWFKWLIISTVLHMVVLAAFSIPVKKGYKRFEPTSSYSVNLVGSIGAPAGSGEGAAVSAPEKKAVPERQAPAPRARKAPKPIPQRKEKEAVSLSRKKVPPKVPPANDSPTKEELSRLEDRLKEMRRRTEYFDVTRTRSDGATGKGGGSAVRGGTGPGGLPMAGEGGGRPLDPFTQRYIVQVWEKIKDAWGLPGMSAYKKDLETVVTIRIRKDGRIVDINVEKRSGNRVYDESILRALRSVDPLPPIPASLNTDSIEVGFRFLPGDKS